MLEGDLEREMIYFEKRFQKTLKWRYLIRILSEVREYIMWRSLGEVFQVAASEEQQ